MHHASIEEETSWHDTKIVDIGKATILFLS